MEHSNHKIAEVNFSLRVLITVDEIIENISKLTQQLLALGFIFIKRVPTNIKISFSSSNFSIEPEHNEGIFQLLYHNRQTDLIFNIGVNYISFHCVKNYQGFEQLQKVFIKPLTNILSELIPSIKIVGSGFTYVNLFPVNEIKLIHDWFPFISNKNPNSYFTDLFYATKSEYEMEEGNVIDLIDGGTDIVDHEYKRFFRLNFTSSINYNAQKQSTPGDIIKISEQLHMQAKDLFNNNTGNKLIEYIN